MANRKNYSVSVNVDSKLHSYLETLPNVSKFFILAAEHYINDKITLDEIKIALETLSSKLDKIRISGSSGNAVKGIEKPPKLSRGRR